MSPPPNRPPNRPGGPASGRPAGGSGSIPRVVPGAGARPGAPAARPAPRDLTPARGLLRQPAAPNPAEQQRALEAELERRFDALESRIEQLKVRYNRYFAGDPQQRLPPDSLRDEIEREMRQLRTMNMRRSADNFRLGSIEARLS